MGIIKTERTINAPATTVFRTVADIQNFAKAIPDIVGVEFLSEQKSGVGTRFRETREINGKEAATELEVTEYSENDYIRLVADSHGTVWDSAFTVKENGQYTTLKLVMESKPYKFLPKLMTPFIQYFIRKALEKDMDAVKIYCEK